MCSIFDFYSYQADPPVFTPLALLPSDNVLNLWERPQTEMYLHVLYAFPPMDLHA